MNRKIRVLVVDDDSLLRKLVTEQLRRADFDAALKLDSRQPRSLYGRGTAKLKKGDTAGGNADLAAA